MITADVWQAIEAEKLARRGSWPVAGGWLDQTKVLLEAIGEIRSADAHFRSPAIGEEDEENGG